MDKVEKIIHHLKLIHQPEHSIGLAKLMVLDHKPNLTLQELASVDWSWVIFDPDAIGRIIDYYCTKYSIIQLFDKSGQLIDLYQNGK